MSEFALFKELSKKLSKDFGATPLSINKTGLTKKEFLLKRKLKISLNDDQNKIQENNVWYGEALGYDSITCCLLTILINSDDSFEIVCIIGFKNLSGELQSDAIRIGYKYDYLNDSDPGTIVAKAGNQWVPVDLVQKLQILLGFEFMIQDGVSWNPSFKIAEDFWTDLYNLIEEDYLTDSSDPD